jgi:hypothetical protein
MLSVKRKQSEATPGPRQFELRWDVLFKDLSFLGSLSIARFMVWRVLRRRLKERAARLKRIKLVHDSGHEEG